MVATSPTSSPAGVVGRTVPRTFTPPLVTGPPGPCGCGCALTPDTSEGYDLIDWATDVLRAPPRPWQRWAAIHGLELLPDGRPRFRILLVVAGRQSGKTWLPSTLSTWWQFCCNVPLILGTSTKLDYARESWNRACALVEAAPALSDLRGRRWRREANGEQESWSATRARYKIAPANAEGGRSLTVHRLILDELRQHHTHDAWSASVYAGNAVRDFQCWALSNAGTAQSIVLNELQDACETYIRTGVGDPRTGMFSWSAPDDADPLDVAALAQANPSMNLPGGPSSELLLQQASSALAAGGSMLAEFRTEVMCIRVTSMAPAVDGAAWHAARQPGPLSGVAGRVAACLDVAPDGAHVALVVAATVDVGGQQKVRVEVAGGWDDLATARAALPALVARIRPYALGWFPGGPAAALDADLRDRRKGGVRGWPPRGVRVAEITAAVPAVCLGFSALVAAGGVLHSGQDLLDAQVAAAQRRTRGDAWTFDRRPGDPVHVDAVYAAAGAVHLARTVPPRRTSAPLTVVPD